MHPQPVLLDGQWRPAQSVGTFQADNPTTREPLPDVFPISAWADCDLALAAAAKAAVTLRTTPASQLAEFLETFAQRIESQADRLVSTAHAETALAVKPRLADVELPRTTNQLRAAAACARDGSWAHPTIDTKLNIRSYLAPLGPVCVFGPNNFPFAYNGAAGGDFASAIATGNPVIAKANSSHPATTRLLAELAFEALQAARLPLATVQLIYRTPHDVGERLVSDPRMGATGYTGSRSAGLALKHAADAAGKPIYLELSSLNPVVILPGALRERGAEIVEQFTSSCLMGAGQFCTNPGLVLLVQSPESEAFAAAVTAKFRTATVGTLLSRGVATSLAANVAAIQRAGARVLVGNTVGGGAGYSFANTLLTVSGAKFLAAPEALQTEAFGNASLFVMAADQAEALAVLDHLEGNLTGSIYSDTRGGDDAAYEAVAAILRWRVGRLLNDKMPTGVAVSPAMNHGGPYPATGHAGFTAVGFPASMLRFAMLQCYDNVRPERLPECLRNVNPGGRAWRLIDGRFTQANVDG